MPVLVLLSYFLRWIEYAYDGKGIAAAADMPVFRGAEVEIDITLLAEMSIVPAMKTTILDHIDRIEVSGNVFGEPCNEYWELLCLWDGMEFLYHQVAQCDAFAKEAINLNGEYSVTVLGSDPRLSQIPKTILTASFHWYAISACQYVRIIGRISGRKDPEYINSVIPEVLSFRNKVAAHYAWYSKSNDTRDNNAERVFSIMPKLSFENDAFYICGFQYASGNSTTEELKPWNICKVHEALRQRYWPGRSEG